MEGMTQAGLLGLWESKFSEATPTAKLSTLNQGVDCYVRMYMCTPWSFLMHGCPYSRCYDELVFCKEAVSDSHSMNEKKWITFSNAPDSFIAIKIHQSGRPG